MHKANVSVIIPAYNREKEIKKCVDSVLSQTVKPYEIIIVDDCSNDSTVNVVKSIDSELIRVFVLDRNSGAQAARNRGIVESKGDWIAFHDSDDEWLPDKLERQIKELKKVNYDPMTVVHGNAIVCDQNGNKKTLNIPFTDGADVYSLMLERYAPLFPGILTSRDALEKIGFLDQAVISFQEWDTSIRLSKYCRFVHISEPLFIYNIHSGDTISKDNVKAVNGYQYIIEKFKEEIILNCGKNAWYRHNFLQFMACMSLDIKVPENICSVMKDMKAVYYSFLLIKKFPRNKKMLRLFEDFVLKIILR